MSIFQVGDVEDADVYDKDVASFLCGCNPCLEHLLMTFFKLGMETMDDLEGVPRWGHEIRNSWLLKDTRLDWGIKPLHMKALSIAFSNMEKDH